MNEITTVHGVLQFIHDELAKDPTKWTQGANARTKKGAVIGPQEAPAVCWCLMAWMGKGAALAEYPIFHKPAHDLYQETYKHVASVIDSLFPRSARIPRGDNGVLDDCVNIALWNDVPDRTIDEVMLVLKGALATTDLV